MGIFDNLRASLSKRPAMLGREPNAGNMPKLRPAVMPQTFPNMPNFQGMPNLQGIGGIPGLQNIDFSNLPMGMDFSNFDPRAINANPQGFQNMIEQAQNQELLAQQTSERNILQQDMFNRAMAEEAQNPTNNRITTMPVLGNTPRGPGMNLGDMLMRNPDGSPMMGSGPGMNFGDRFKQTNAREYAVLHMGMPRMEGRPINQYMGSPGGTFLDFTIICRGEYDPQRLNPLPPSMGLNPPPGGFEGSLPVQPTAPVQQPLAPYTGGNDPAPYVSNQQRNETGLDALSQQLLFGLDGKGGFIPGAMRAAETSFFNPDGTPRVVEQQVAGLTPDQQRAMEMARGATGIQDQYLGDAQSAFRSSVGELGSGLDRARQRELESLGLIQGGVGSLGRELSDVENIQRGATGNFGTQLGGLAGRSIGATDEFGNRLGESENLLRGTLGGYDQSLTSQFYNPYEQQVVDQTIEDVFKAGEKQDMAQRARDIQTGGESAFGSRARLSAEERREALGRGLGQSLGSLRAQGFGQAQSTGLNEFARQRAQEMATSQGLSGLAGSRLGSQQNLTNQLSGFAGQQLGAQQGLASNLGALAGTRFGAQQTQAGALSNLGNLEAQMGQQRAQAQQNLGSNLQNIGNQAQQASAFDINQLMGAGQMQQQQQQAQLDATRANQLQAQQAPLAQYQSLLPFMQSVPTGSFQTSTTFAPKPSALQSGLGVGLSTLGALGNFFNQPQGQQQQRSNAGYTI
jgi:hypothetical protein